MHLCAATRRRQWEVKAVRPLQNNSRAGSLPLVTLAATPENRLAHRALEGGQRTTGPLPWRLCWRNLARSTH